MSLSNRELIDRAAALLNPHTTATGRLFGDVAAVLVSTSGKIFEGVCVDTSSWGLCAERSAIAAMITRGEYQIGQIVAVWRNPDSNKLHVLPPCGHCREFMRQIDERNLATIVILGLDAAAPLAKLLPAHEWPSAIE